MIVATGPTDILEQITTLRQVATSSPLIVDDAVHQLREVLEAIASGAVSTTESKC